ncbi:MAG: TMEM165/GDT1 family protein [Piscinibacter sp.]|jgi:putative Ca2+/H+ antiporter (TMEM165/GDT1 family)|nr:TMEM165/GDT1 family protein [Piscinibacter sp.]
MDFKLLATVFGTVFLAELGDKTQLATLLFASREGASLLTVFIAASLALVATSAVGVLAGAAISNYVEPKYLSYAAGVGFIVIGAWTLWQA